MRVCFACAIFLVLVGCAAGTRTPIPELHLDPAVACSEIPVKYCKPETGCSLSKQGSCVKSSNPPVINCTALLIVSGGAVADASKDLKDNLKALDDLSYMSMKNTSKAFDTVTDLGSKYDSNLKSYNASLMDFTYSEAMLATYQAQLDALQQTCSATDPPPPPTCPTDIAKLQAKVAAQNTSCAMKWIKVDTNRQTMDLSKGLVDTAQAALQDMLTKSASTYSSMKTMLDGFVKEKDDSLKFWTAIKSACTGPPTAKKVAVPQPGNRQSSRLIA